MYLHIYIYICTYHSVCTSTMYSNINALRKFLSEWRAIFNLGTWPVFGGLLYVWRECCTYCMNQTIDSRANSIKKNTKGKWVTWAEISTRHGHKLYWTKRTDKQQVFGSARPWVASNVLLELEKGWRWIPQGVHLNAYQTKLGGDMVRNMAQ